MPRAKRKKVPPFAIANAFVISRVPDTGSISQEELVKSLNGDLRAAHSLGIKTDRWLTRSIDAQLSCLLSRYQLGAIPKNASKDGKLHITRNERTERYLRTIHRGVWTIVDKIPITSNPLLLLAGTAPNESAD